VREIGFIFLEFGGNRRVQALFSGLGQQAGRALPEHFH
jgi:hypothetical protein